MKVQRRNSPCHLDFQTVCRDSDDVELCWKRDATGVALWFEDTECVGFIARRGCNHEICGVLLRTTWQNQLSNSGAEDRDSLESFTLGLRCSTSSFASWLSASPHGPVSSSYDPPSCKDPSCRTVVPDLYSSQTQQLPEPCSLVYSWLHDSIAG